MFHFGDRRKTMKILQINAVYEKNSTGRTTKEMHDYFLSNNIESYVAAPDLNGCTEYTFQIGSRIDRKAHAFFSRLFGLQGYFSHFPTIGLIKYIKQINPDIVILRNLHGNYVNLKMLLNYLAETKTPIIIVLHDCWFFTGKCVYYIEDHCDRWKSECGHCPALKKGNPSLILDRSRKMLMDKKKWFSQINKLAVIGVSKWVSEDASISILKNAIHSYIYNWIDLEQFKRHDMQTHKKEYGIDKKYVVLGIAAFWSTAKGIDVFNDLADILSEDFAVVLVGDTSRLQRKNEKIHYIGSISNVNELINMYSIADVFVNPSIQETFGKTTAEALACGTPVVAYNGTATPELIGHDESCGILVDSVDPVDYKEAIIKVVTSEVDYKRTCRNRAEQLFDKKTNIEKYMQLIFQMTDNA